MQGQVNQTKDWIAHFPQSEKADQHPWKAVTTADHSKNYRSATMERPDSTHFREQNLTGMG